MKKLLTGLAVPAGLAALVGLAESGPALGSELAATPPTSVVATADQPGEPIDLGLPTVLLTAPAVTAAGDRPAFAWEPVAGAATYQLAVLTAEGVPLWAWRGPTTNVILGGWPEAPVAAAPGPLLLGPATWFVVAFDDAGRPIANSVMRPVSPE
jgi:hypothetical protein